MRVGASYTVEAAWVISICMLIMGSAIILSFRIYDNTLSYVKETSAAEFDAALRFREIDAGKDLIDYVTGGKK